MEAGTKRLRECRNRCLVPQLCFPPGFRYVPTDTELVDVYLRRKIQGLKVPLAIINEVNVLDYDPEKLVEKYKQFGEDRWYFFTVRERKYEHGARPSRTTSTGSWKATGRAEKIYKTLKDGEKEQVGTKRILVFYVGQEKKDWTMHEYVMSGKAELHQYVLCTIQKKQHCKGRDDDGDGDKCKRRRKEHSQAEEGKGRNGDDDNEKCKRKKTEPGEEKALEKAALVSQKGETIDPTLHASLPCPHTGFASDPHQLMPSSNGDDLYQLAAALDTDMSTHHRLMPSSNDNDLYQLFAALNADTSTHHRLMPSSDSDNLYQLPAALDARTSTCHQLMPSSNSDELYQLPAALGTVVPSDNSSDLSQLPVASSFTSYVLEQDNMLPADPVPLEWQGDANGYQSSFLTDFPFQEGSLELHNISNQLSTTKHSVDPDFANGVGMQSCAAQLPHISKLAPSVPDPSELGGNGAMQDLIQATVNDNMQNDANPDVKPGVERKEVKKEEGPPPISQHLDQSFWDGFMDISNSDVPDLS